MKRQIAIVAGGNSSEHDVSLRSAAGIGFDEAGQPQAGDEVLDGGHGLTAANEHAVGDVHLGVGTQEVVQRKLVERQRFYEHVAGGIGHANQVEVALQDTVLARCAVDGDVGKVEGMAAVGCGEGEVVAVDGTALVAVVGGPVAARDIYDVAVVLFAVHKR